MQLKGQEYIQACKVDGGSTLRIILKHLLPNCIPMLIVSITLGIPSAILSEASLSYLGLGVPSPKPSWGSMIAESQDFIRSNTYYSLFPGVCIIDTVMARSRAGIHIALSVLAKLTPKRLFAIFMQLERLRSLISSVSMLMSFLWGCFLS